MNRKNIGFGLFLVLFGAIILLKNIGLLNINFHAGFEVMWPFILIGFGIGFIFKEKRGIVLITWILVLLGIIGFSIGKSDNPFNTKNSSSSKNMIVGLNKDELKVDIPLDNAKEKIHLNVDLGACNLDVDDCSDKLAAIYSNIKDLNYSYDESTGVIKLSNKSNPFNNSQNQRLDMELNDSIIWDIDFSMGAVDGDINLEDIAAENINFSMGAVDTKIYLSDKVNNTKVNISSGAADIVLYVPKNSGIQVVYSGALNDIDFDGISVEKNNNTYKTQGYDQKDKKISINLSTGVSSVKIKSYS